MQAELKTVLTGVPAGDLLQYFFNPADGTDFYWEFNFIEDDTYELLNGGLLMINTKTKCWVKSSVQNSV